MLFTLKALSIQFIDILGTGGPCCEPTIFRHYLEAFNGRIVAGCFGQFCGYGFSSEVVRRDLVGGKTFENRLLLWCGRCINALIKGTAKFFDLCG
jgi:hypothetical protein